MEEQNELALVSNAAAAARYFGRHAVMNRVVGHSRRVALRHIGVLSGFSPSSTRKRWTLRLRSGETRPGQVDNPDDDHYIYLAPFVNYLAAVRTAEDATRYIGADAYMWDGGWSPVKKHSRKIQITGYKENSPTTDDNIPCPWQGRHLGMPWVGQSTHIRSGYYVIPVDAFHPLPAETPAESLTRIFLGRR